HRPTGQWPRNRNRQPAKRGGHQLMARTGYVARIRDKIGTDPLMLIAVSVFIFDKDGRFLLAQQHGHDNWVTIGGAVEMGETPADAAVRECWEETGALVRPTKLLGVFGGEGLKI